MVADVESRSIQYDLVLKGLPARKTCQKAVVAKMAVLSPLWGTDVNRFLLGSREQTSDYGA